MILFLKSQFFWLFYHPNSLNSLLRFKLIIWFVSKLLWFWKNADFFLVFVPLCFSFGLSSNSVSLWQLWQISSGTNLVYTQLTNVVKTIILLLCLLISEFSKFCCGQVSQRFRAVFCCHFISFFLLIWKPTDSLNFIS